MKIRIKYAKTGVLKFVGHLDLLRYFQKAFRRAKVDIAYSKGYSPHQIMSFAAPLGIGLTSDGEYMDAEFHTVESSAVMIQKLNEEMSEGLTILEFLMIPDDTKNAMSSVAGADYMVTLRDGYFNDDILLDGIQSFYGQATIDILKKTKKSEKEVDIKPMIYDMHKEGDGIFLKLCTGSANNLKPETVMDAYCQFLKIEYQKFGFIVHRKETYMQTNQDEPMSLIPLGAIGQTIE